MMDRKEKVKLLEKHLNTKSKYLGVPSFAYEIETPDETYTINREGNIILLSGEEVELEEILTGTRAEEPENLEVELEIPMDGHQGNTLRNILNLIYSKQTLIKKALELEEDLVEEEFIKALKEERVISIDSFEKALNKIGYNGHPGVDFDFENKTFTFKNTKGEAATWLFALINKKAKKLKHTRVNKTDTDNEKYTFRTWLNSLGMIGEDYAEIRKELLKNLTGNPSFRTPKKEAI